jgi:hypothetical protein
MFSAPGARDGAEIGDNAIPGNSQAVGYLAMASMI